MRFPVILAFALSSLSPAQESVKLFEFTQPPSPEYGAPTENLDHLMVKDLPSLRSPEEYARVGNASRVRFLLVGDAHASNIGDAVTRDAGILETALDEFRHSERHPEWADAITVDRLGTETPITPEAIFTYYANLRTGPTETLVFYFSGHGEMNEKGGNNLTLSGDTTPSKGIISRARLRFAMQKKGVRKIIIITNICNALPEGRMALVTPTAGSSYAEKVFEDLFFKGLGIVDINSSSPGQLTWTGVFTPELFRLLMDPDSSIDTNKDNFVSWPEFFVALRGKVSAEFKRVKEANISAGIADEDMRNSSMEPYFYTLPVNSDMGNDVTLVSYASSHNWINFGQKGLLLDTQLLLYGRKGSNIRINIYFKDQNNSFLRDRDQKYSTDGFVTLTSGIFPISTDIAYVTKTMFLPVGQFDLGRNQVFNLTPVLEVHIQDENTWVKLGRAELQGFSVRMN